jgi:hypothetical protein
VILQMSNQYDMVLNLTPDQTACEATGWTRFGLFGAQTTASVGDSYVEAYIDDLYVAGTRVGFDAAQSMAQFTANGGGPFVETEAGANQQPSWDPTCPRPVPGSVTRSQDFGWKDTANVNSGSETGELGGLITRRDAYAVKAGQCPAGPAYYAYPVSGLNFRTPLHADGNLVLHHAHNDALVLIGWFKDAGTFDRGYDFPRSSVGMYLNNVSDDGIRPVPFARSTDPAHFIYEGQQHPVINRFTKYHFELDWLPAGPGGTLTLTIGGFVKSVTIPDIGSPATFDRFGLRTGDVGGSPMWIYLDDLQFTSSPSPTPGSSSGW